MGWEQGQLDVYYAARRTPPTFKILLEKSDRVRSKGVQILVSAQNNGFLVGLIQNSKHHLT